MLEEEPEEEEGASLTRGCSCDLGVDRPEEGFDTVSVFSSEETAGVVVVGFSCWEEEEEEGTSDDGVWELEEEEGTSEEEEGGPVMSMSSHEST